MNRDNPSGEHKHYLLQFTGSMPVIDSVYPGCYKIVYNRCFHVGPEQEPPEMDLPKPINPDNHAI